MISSSANPIFCLLGIKIFDVYSPNFTKHKFVFIEFAQEASENFETENT